MRISHHYALAIVLSESLQIYRYINDMNLANATSDPNISLSLGTMPPLAPNAATTTSLMCAPVTANGTLSSCGQYRRVPCKARGVRADHNSKTAYFDIPLDAKHGMLLVCSHSKCSESGRRFRYCAMCKVPVAKRNFSKRHGHGLIKPSRSGGGGFAIAESTVPVMEVSMAGNKHRRSVSYDAAEYYYQEKLRKLAEHMMSPVQEQVQPTIASQPQLMPAAAVESATNMNPAPSTAGMKIQLNPTEFQWLALLHNRPPIEDTEATKSWVEKVMTLSQPSTTSFASVTPPSSGDNEMNSETSIPSDASAEPFKELAPPTVAPAPLTLDQQMRANDARIESGLALAEAASLAADAVPSVNESDGKPSPVSEGTEQPAATGTSDDAATDEALTAAVASDAVTATMGSDGMNPPPQKRLRSISDEKDAPSLLSGERSDTGLAKVWSI